MSEHEQPQTDTPWWRRAVVYQIYPRSFADGNGDGTGDIAGIRSRLSHLQDLGVDAVWFNPWYLSPLADGGYDVTDYRRIDPRFGTIEEATALIAEAHEHGIKVIVDIVPNHTSDQHAWFVEAVNAEPGDPVRDRYHILPGRGDDGSEPPNNWMSVFGGPAWHRLDDGEWYLHLFAPEQPDVNWRNPEVADEYDAVLRFWLDRGVDGFRVDVASSLTKDMTYPDIETDVQAVMSSNRVPNHPHWDRDDVHPIIRRWRALLDSYDGERMMVAEAWVSPETYPLYLRPDEYHQVFNFDLLLAGWDRDEMASIITDSVDRAAAVGSTPTWVLSNHDVMRETTRYGLPNGTNWRTWSVEGPFDSLDPELGLRRARAAALLILSLPGSAYVYQGEELGLPEVWDLPEEVLDDPVWERSEHRQRGRDGCRVPIPWSMDGPSFGFSEVAGWLPQPAEFAGYAVEAQTGVSSSTLELYRRTLAARREYGTDDEQITMLELGDEVLAYCRGNGLRCIVNFASTALELPEYSKMIVASNSEQDDSVLEPDCAVWVI
ncbi:MAG: glycoside hydrolase family 13 protein [Acidimicrobiia bacterium]|nr:glycoside hydrolase family 13 protein [Acidimicrobiia bacterium]